MSVISGVSEYDRMQFGSPSSVSSFPINQDNVGPQSVISSATTAANTILPPEQANINFRPTTTAMGKISKLKLQVSLDSTIYTAGGILTGRLALTSSSARSLKLGEISVELTAYEELSAKEYTASQSFLSSRLVFQSENLPPSNAVQGPKEDGYWMAKKGKTTFPFAFKIPIDAPSSIAYGNLASLKYVVTGVVQFMNNNKEDTLFKSKEAFVVEAWDGHNPIYKQPIDQINMRQLWMGGSGAVMLEGILAETLFQSGGNVSVQVRVKNETKRRVQGIKVSIAHKLIILSNKYKKEIDDVKVYGDTVAEEWFRSKDFLFDSGEDRSTTVHINVPKNVRTIRNTALFEVVCYVVISLYLGPFTKDLSVHLPVYIAHSASIQPAPIADADLNVFPNHYNMMDENAEFFVEDNRADESDVLGRVSTPVNIPKKGDRVLPWSNDDDDIRGRYSPPKGSAGSYIFGSASPKKIGSFASSLLGRPKQMSPTNPSKLIAKSPPLAPASPYAYIPAIERVRYLSFTTQEQGAIQKRPFTATASKLGGYGKHNGSQQLSPPTSEYEFVNGPYEPSKNVQKWLDKQDNQSERSSPSSFDGAEPVATPGGKSPWDHINNTQEILNNQQNSDFSSESFKRNENIASSPSGPSGLTLLMRQKSQMPKIQDNMFEEVMSTTSNNTYGAYENVPKGRPLPTPKPDIIDEKKSDILQIPNNSNNNGGNLSSLFKWGTSWIGYGNGNQIQNSSATDISEKTQLQSIDENDEIPKNRPRRQLPSPPTSAAPSVITDATSQDETQVPKTRPRRSLPAPPTSVPQKPITPNSPIMENSIMEKDEIENTSVNISRSPPRDDITKPLNIERVNNVAPVTMEQQSPPKVTTLPENSDKLSSSPPKRSYFGVTKASIFAALGQKPLGMFTTPPPAPDPVVPPKKTLPIASSPPKQKEFNVKRKPVELNSLIKNDIKIAEMVKNELENSNEDDIDIQNPSSPTITNKVTSPKLTKLAIPPAVPKKSPSKPVQVTSSVPNDDKFDNNSNNNDTNYLATSPKTPPVIPKKPVQITSSVPNDDKSDNNSNNNNTNNLATSPKTPPVVSKKPVQVTSSVPNDDKSDNNSNNNNTNDLATSPKTPPVVPKKPVQITSSVPNDDKSDKNSNNNNTNDLTTSPKTPPDVPKKSIPIPSKSTQATSPVPINDNDISKSPSSPVDPAKLLASPTTYINTTIAKPVVAMDEKDKLEERLLSNNIKKKKSNENEEDEGRLTAKITEPPKPVLSPRLQEYIKNYNKATNVDKN